MRAPDRAPEPDPRAGDPSQSHAPGASAPKPTSQKQIDANRLNAKKSTGPRTAAGQARSRMNALRHGLCARVVLLPGESRSEYGKFAMEILAELKPKGLVQQILAGRVASLSWALARLPESAKYLVERGENARFNGWFKRRGLRDRIWFDTYNKQINPDYVSREPVGTDEDLADREILQAYVDGDPPPDPHKPAGVIAAAIAGKYGFDDILKLDDHERRLWSALQSTLRSLERRQKIDGCAEDEDEPKSEGLADSGEPQSPCGAGVSPAPCFPSKCEGETPSPQDEEAALKAEWDDLPRENDPPARNEPISDDVAVAAPEGEAHNEHEDARDEPSSDQAPDAHTAGAERTHLPDRPLAGSDDQTAHGDDPRPPN